MKQLALKRVNLRGKGYLIIKFEVDLIVDCILVDLYNVIFNVLTY